MFPEMDSDSVYLLCMLLKGTEDGRNNNKSKIPACFPIFLFLTRTQQTTQPFHNNLNHNSNHISNFCFILIIELKNNI